MNRWYSAELRSARAVMKSAQVSRPDPSTANCLLSVSASAGCAISSSGNIAPVTVSFIVLPPAGMKSEAVALHDAERLLRAHRVGGAQRIETEDHRRVVEDRIVVAVEHRLLQHLADIAAKRLETAVETVIADHREAEAVLANLERKLVSIRKPEILAFGDRLQAIGRELRQ